MKVPRSHLLRIMGRLLQGIGALFYATGAAVPIGLVVAIPDGWRILRYSERPWLMLLILIAVFVAALLWIYLGHRIFLHGKRLLAKRRSLQASNLFSIKERPVLYLRSFSDETVTSATPVAFTFKGSVELRSLTTEEEHLAKSLEDLGQFVAIANPHENLPQLGAVRMPADQRDWQEKVLHLLSRARLIVFRVGTGNWLWWEIEQATKRVPLNRLLFLIPDDPAIYDAFRARLGPILGREIPDLPFVKVASVSIVAFLHFETDGTPRFVPLQDARFRGSLSQPLRPMLRIALRPVFQRLGAAWTPPPISLTAFLQILPNLWVFGLCLYWLVDIFPILLDLSFDIVSLLLLALGLFLLFGIVKSGIFLWFTGKVLAGAFLQVRPGSWEDSDVPPDSRIIQFLEATYKAWASGALASLEYNFEKEASQQSQKKFVGQYLPAYGGALHVLSEDFPPCKDEYLVGLGEDDEGVRPARDRGWFVLTNRRLLQKDGRDGMFREVLLREVEDFKIGGLWHKTLVIRMKTEGEIRFKKLQMCPKDEALRESIRLSRSQTRHLRLVPRPPN